MGNIWKESKPLVKALESNVQIAKLSKNRYGIQVQKVVKKKSW